VLLTFLGYAVNDTPVFVFRYDVPPQTFGVPIHDHRNNLNGGFLFCTFHSGHLSRSHHLRCSRFRSSIPPSRWVFSGSPADFDSRASG
jgi:hypothetical protein